MNFNLKEVLLQEPSIRHIDIGTILKFPLVLAAIIGLGFVVYGQGKGAAEFAKNLEESAGRFGTKYNPLTSRYDGGLEAFHLSMQGELRRQKSLKQ